MLARRGSRPVIAEPIPQPLSLIRRSGFLEELGPDGVFDDPDEALAALSGRAVRGA